MDSENSWLTLKIRTPEKIAVINQKFELCGFITEKCEQQTKWQTVQTLIQMEQSDLGLHCLSMHFCPKS